MNKLGAQYVKWTYDLPEGENLVLKATATAKGIESARRAIVINKINEDGSVKWIAIEEINDLELNTPTEIKMFFTAPKKVEILFYNYTRTPAIQGSIVEYSDIMLSKEDIPFEPYQLPSPDNPISIENVGDSHNLFNINGNINDKKDGKPFEKNTAVDGKLVTTHNNAVDYGAGQKIKVKPNVPMYMKITLNKSDYTLKENSDNDWIGLIAVYDMNTGLNIGSLRFEKSNMESVETLTKTLKFTPTDEYITQGFGGNFSYVLEPNTTIAFSNIMISYDNINYEPYEEKAIEVAVRGKNLIDIDAMCNETLIKTGDTYTLTKGSSRLSKSAPLKEKKGTTLYLSYNLIDSTTASKRDLLFACIKSKKETIYGNFSTNSITLPEDIEEIKFYIEHTESNGSYIKFNNLIISKEPIDNYEPYEEERTKIILPQNLKGIGNKFDTLLQNGTIEKRFEKIVLDGTENWTPNGSQGGMGFVLESIGGNNDGYIKTNIMSNYFKSTSQGNIYSGLTESGIASRGGEIKKIYIISKDNFKTVAECKQWLASKYSEGNPVEIYYELAELETVELAESEKEKLNNIKSLDNYTKINIDYKTEIEVNTLISEKY